MLAALGDPLNFPQSVRRGSNLTILIFQNILLIFYLGHQSYNFDQQLSGPPRCLCSKAEQCQMNADNELDVVANVTQVEPIAWITAR